MSLGVRRAASDISTRKQSRALVYSEAGVSRLIRYEFLGSWLYFWLLCVLVVTIPIAILYLMQRTVRVENEMGDVEEFLTGLKSGKWQ